MLTPKKHKKEGVPNDKLVLKQLLTYVKSVYHIPEKIKGLTDPRHRKSIPLFNSVMTVLVCFMLQYQSFHEIFTYQTTHRRIRHLVKGRIPKTDAARELLKNLDTGQVRQILESMIKQSCKNKVLRQGTIDGYKVAALDGVELFTSYFKKCEECLTRVHRNGKTEHFHRSVVCMTVGNSPHIILGEDMLSPRDGNEKDEGELTGGKRLIRDLHGKYGHFADVIVGDALYLNAPFIKTVEECGMNVVIRLKDETRLIYKDAEGLFQKGMGRTEDFEKKDIKVKAWDISGFEMEGLGRKLRVIRYEEEWKGEKEVRRMWIVTDLKGTDNRSIWQMMHRRWDIENNGFHQLKKYYHAGHCYEHAAAETLFLLNIIAFNIREMYMYRRSRMMQGGRMTRREVTEMLRDEILEKDYKDLIDDG